MLTLPQPRQNPNDFVPFGPIASADDASFVCRYGADFESPNRIKMTAGSQMNLQFQFNVNHVGDAALFITYDVDKPRAEMEFFKIGNFFQFFENQSNLIPVVLPEWLPEGDAILRLDWLAFHLFPMVEFYAYCVDIEIENENSDKIVDLDSIVTYKMIGDGADIYPGHANDPGYNLDAPKRYRDPFNAPANLQFMFGPPCAHSLAHSEMNSCHLTQKGTLGYIVPSMILSGGNHKDDGLGGPDNFLHSSCWPKPTGTSSCSKGWYKST